MILVAGEALIDLLVNADGAIKAVPGGGPFNVARGLARLGCPTGFIGRLSTDGFGQELRRVLVADGVTLAIEEPIDVPTTLAVARLDARGAASYTFYVTGTSAALLTPHDITAAQFDGAVGLHVGSLGLVVEPMASAVADLVSRAPGTVLVMVDINARPAAIGDVVAYRQSVLDLLRRADVVKASTEDLEVLLPDFEVADAARRVLAAGARVVLVTDGPRAVRVYGSGFRVEVPAPEANVVDTVGAGDAFGAGFLAWWHRRAYPHEALADRGLVVEAVGRAGEVAALTCARHGADPPHITDLSHGW